MARRPCCSILFVGTLVSCLVAACGTSPVGRARTWLALGEETRLVHTTFAVLLAPSPSPASPPVRASVTKRHAGPDVRLFTADHADCRTLMLGDVYEEATDGRYGAARERLKAKARALGADAIVGYRLWPAASPGSNSMDLAGVAARCLRPGESPDGGVSATVLPRAGDDGIGPACRPVRSLAVHP